MKNDKENQIEKAEFEIEFETVGYISRNDMDRLRAGDDETQTFGVANTCTLTNATKAKTCIKVCNTIDS